MSSMKADLVKYTLLPGIVPRVKGAFGSGFSLIASLIAVVYYNAGLLPAGHVYLDAKNYGKFGVRHVIAEAANNLVFDRKHIDKIIVFFLIILGLGLLVAQIVLLVVAFVTSNQVLASTPVPLPDWSFYNMFWDTLAPHTSKQDIAFIVLESVFGVNQFTGTASPIGFFDSCVSDLAIECENMIGEPVASLSASVYPKPFHNALHLMLHFYSLGIAFLASVIILYFIVAVVGETITSGTPFGKRMNRAWFLPRLIMFFTLIAPVGTSGPTGNNDGVNVGQLIVLGAAKFGSNMATNAWIIYVRNAATGVATPLGDAFVMTDMHGDADPRRRDFVARPNVPAVGELTQFMHMVRMCMFAEKIVNGLTIKAYAVREHVIPGTGGGAYTYFSTATPQPTDYATMGFTGAVYAYDNIPLFEGYADQFYDVVEFSRYQNVIIRFGHYNPPDSGMTTTIGTSFDPDNPPGHYKDELGYVDPLCGELQFDLASLDPFVVGTPTLFGIQQNYYESIREYLQDDITIDVTAYCMLQAVLPYHQDNECVDENYFANPTFQGNPHFVTNQTTSWLTTEAARSVIERYNSKNQFYIVGEQTDYGLFNYLPAEDMFNHAGPFSVLQRAQDITYANNLLIRTEVMEKGWAGAGMWYNQIANINGLMATAVNNFPRPYKYPKVMEQVADYHKTHDSNMSNANRFNPRLQNGQLVDLPRPGDQYIAAALFSSYAFWNSAAVQQTVYNRHSGNAILDVINTLLGTYGLYDIVDNLNVHPMALLSSMGKSMVEAALRNMFGGIAGQVIQLVSDDFISSVAKAASSFAFRFGMIGLSIGFILFYILPLMPFIYFFFAFGGWIKSVFEAIVAMPLWALAHIKLDGEGLPGPWATNGYFLIFEIFLRPTLIIAGFILSNVLFVALVDVLNVNFSLVTMNATGFDLEKVMYPTEGPTPVNNPIGAGPAPILIDDPGGRSLVDYWRGTLDEFFYTAVYIIIVYMIGLSCFKLIDQIPNNIMRWMGVTVSTFHEQAGDPAGELVSRVYRASQMTNAQLTGFIKRMDGRGGSGSEVTDNLIQQQFANK